LAHDGGKALDLGIGMAGGEREAQPRRADGDRRRTSASPTTSGTIALVASGRLSRRVKWRALASGSAA
jgi:hypothetical protein